MSIETLHIAVEDTSEAKVLRLSGELDCYSSSQLSDIHSKGLLKANRLIVDLNGIEYIDSAGLAALVRLWVEAEESKVAMTISCGNPRIRRVLEITGLIKLFQMNDQDAG